jgi:hypothetical protein
MPQSPAAAAGQPLQRRAPLYDASQHPDEANQVPFRDRRSHPRPGGSRPNGDSAGQQSRLTPSQVNQPAPLRSVPGQNGESRNGANGSQPEETEPDSLDSTIIRTRREPFGPVTRSQAIIDLSARKRPRSPYSS